MPPQVPLELSLALQMPQLQQAPRVLEVPQMPLEQVLRELQVPLGRGKREVHEKAILAQVRQSALEACTN